MNIAITMYALVAFVALICAGYNWMYKKEIHRMEKQVGVTIPHSLLQLLTAIISISLFISFASFILLLISFNTR